VHSLDGHSTPGLCVAFSPAGKLLACGGRDHGIRLWDARGGKLEAVLEGHSGDVNSLAFSPDGRWLLSGGSDRTVRLWDRAERTLRRVFTGHGDDVYSVGFAPDSSRFASTSFDGKIRVFGLDGDLPLATLSGPAGFAFRVAFSPDGRSLAASRQRTERETELEIWDLAAKNPPRRLLGHRKLAGSLAYSPDGTVLISGSKDHSVRLWDARSGRLVQVLEHSRDVSAVAFTPDGRRFAAVDWKTIRVYPFEPPAARQDPARLLTEAQEQAGLWLEEFSLRSVRAAKRRP
jgi:WD40 repeat protein